MYWLNVGSSSEQFEKQFIITLSLSAGGVPIINPVLGSINDVKSSVIPNSLPPALGVVPYLPLSDA